jgi:hypothetical protein
MIDRPAPAAGANSVATEIVTAAKTGADHTLPDANRTTRAGMATVVSDVLAQPLAERQGNVISRRSTRIETKVRQSALVDRVARSVKRELKTLGLELQAWQVPEQKAEAVRKQRDCVLHFTTVQQRQRERAAAKATASAAACVLAKRLQNQSPCRPAIKPTRVHALSNIALQKVCRVLAAHAPAQRVRPAVELAAIVPQLRAVPPLGLVPPMCRPGPRVDPCSLPPWFPQSRRGSSRWCTSTSSCLRGSATS